MALSPQQLDRYTTLLSHYWRHPVVIETELGTVAVLMGVLQLALRHPHLPRGSRHVIEGWLAQVLTEIAALSPVLAEGLRAGSDPANDV
jgi:hypothetical protein